jgi:hypothetical protein
MESPQEFVERVEQADLLVGIPAYNNEATIGRVVKVAAEGLARYFPGYRGVVVVSDGGSTDDTRRVAAAVSLPEGVERLVTTYSGIPGKGSAVKLIFDTARRLRCVGVAMVDSDLRSITPEWVDLLLRPVTEGAGLVAPRYNRFKYDGTITNQVAYPFTLALYGVRVRQPIGGDFGLSKELVGLILDSPLWMNPYTPRFGIDISITHTALAHSLKVVEAALGVKVHDVKDPAAHLAPMFRQVAGALFTTMGLYASSWMMERPFQNLPLYDVGLRGKPESFTIDHHKAFQEFEEGYRRHRALILSALPEELVAVVREALKGGGFEAASWAKISFHFARAFFDQGEGVLEGYRALWMGRVARFVQETIDMGEEEAEAKINREAEAFYHERRYLLELWRSSPDRNLK